MRVEQMRPEFVEEFPTSMDSGVLYVSIEYNTCGHLCACGCGNEVMTPLSPVQWALTYDGRNVSLWPSVGNWALPCKSHYVLDRGRVRGARTFTDAEVQRNRVRDQRALAVGHERQTSSTSGRHPSDLELVREDCSDGATDAGDSRARRRGNDAPRSYAVAVGWWRRARRKQSRQ